MMREYSCAICGLFHWVDQYTEKEDGKMEYQPYQGCPNENCVSHKKGVVYSYAVEKNNM